MRSRVAVMVSILLLAAGAGAMWWGCGGNDHDTAAFTGDVISVTPSQAMREAPSRRWLADVRSFALPEAVAQSTCPAKRVIVCATNGHNQRVCVRVNTNDCKFEFEIDTLTNRFADGSITFVDDVNHNEEIDSGEATALLTNPLGSVCNDSVVILNDVAINFGSGSATAGSVEKRPDSCRGSSPTPIPTPYSAAIPLNPPPSSALAFLWGLGAVGLLLPARRRSRR
jgi:hypothetical protein